MEEDEVVLLVVGDDYPMIKTQLTIKQESGSHLSHNLLLQELCGDPRIKEAMVKVEDDKLDEEVVDEIKVEDKVIVEYDSRHSDDIQGKDDDPDYHVSDEEESENDESYSTRNKKPSQPKSIQINPNEKILIHELRYKYPKFDKNPSKLIEYLIEVMHLVKTPKLGPDIYRVDSEMNKYICNTCEVIQDTQASVSAHFQRFHGEKYLHCYACGKEFTNTPNLYKHEKWCKSPDIDLVQQARGIYLAQRGFKRPSFTHIPVRKKNGERYQCDICGAVYKYRRSLEMHAHAHAGRRPHRCALCRAAYTNLPALQRHQEKHSLEQHICDTCGNVFRSRRLLVAHTKIHLEPRLQCARCPRRFLQAAALRRHEAAAHLPPAHACPVCAKKFSQLSYLKSHLKTHGMDIITPKMFYEALPKMTDVQVKEALVVYNSTIQNSEADLVLDDKPVLKVARANKKKKKSNSPDVCVIETSTDLGRQDDPESEISEFIVLKPGNKVIVEDVNTEPSESGQPQSNRPKVKVLFNP